MALEEHRLKILPTQENCSSLQTQLTHRRKAWRTIFELAGIPKARCNVAVHSAVMEADVFALQSTAKSA
jgi:hypothetical protein